MSASDRLDLIVLLDRVEQIGSLTAAARALGISQPSASRLVKRLEELVGVPLLRRSLAAGGSLTEEGKRFLTSARGLIGDWDRAVAGAHDAREAMTGVLRVVAPIAVGQDLLARMAAKFVKAWPGVSFEWRLSDEPIDPSPRGFDLWIRAGEMPTEELVVREVWRISRALVATPALVGIDHPDSLVAGEAVRLTTFTPQIVELSRSDGATFLLDQHPTFITDNLFAARAAVLEGVGYAVLPLWAVQHHLERGELVVVCPDWTPPAVTMSLAYPPTQSRSRRLAEFLAFTKAELTREGGLGFEFAAANKAHETITFARR